MIKRSDDPEFQPEILGDVIYRSDPYALIKHDSTSPVVNNVPGIQVYPLPDKGITYPGSALLATPAPTPTFNLLVDAMVKQVDPWWQVEHFINLTVWIPTRYTSAPGCQEA